jgi:hypothetical protein
MTLSAKMMMFVAAALTTPLVTPTQAIELSCLAPFAPVIDTGSPITMAAEVDPTPLKEKQIDLELTRTPDQDRETREHDKAIQEHKDEINTLMRKLKKQQNSITGR